MAMPTSSHSSIVVDLGEAADLDDATSRLFFSDAGPGASWPVGSEIVSTLTSQESLIALCSKHGVPSELTPVSAEHLGWRACTPPPVGSNRMCVYANALDAGLRFPLHGFSVRVLRHYRLAPSQLTPNSWTYLAAFVLRCQDADVEPLVSVFRHFFTVCALTHGGKPTGRHHFQQCKHDLSRRLFTGVLPTWTGWKSRFFFLDCPSGWDCPVKWGKPRREDARRVQLTSTLTVIQKLKAKGCVDIQLFLANREMPVGDPATLAPLQSAMKVEAGAAGPGAAAENASTSKRRRLSPAGFAPIRASSTGGRSGHIPPASLAPIRASATAGRSGHIPPASLAPIRASGTGGRSGHFPSPQEQSVGESTSAPRELPGMRARAQAVSIGGSSEVTPPAPAPAPHTMCVSDVLQLWEARAKASEQASLITKLNQELHMVKTWNTQWQNELRAVGAKHATEIAQIITAASDRNSHMNEEIVRLNQERVRLVNHLRMALVEVEQHKADHAAEITELKKELAAEAKQLKEEIEDDAEQLKYEGYTQGYTQGYTMGAGDMRDLALAKYKGVINPAELKVELLLDYSHQGASPVAAEDQ